MKTFAPVTVNDCAIRIHGAGGSFGGCSQTTTEWRVGAIVSGHLPGLSRRRLGLPSAFIFSRRRRPIHRNLCCRRGENFAPSEAARHPTLLAAAKDMASQTGCSFFDVRNSADCFEPVSVTSAAQQAVDAYFKASKQSGEYGDLASVRSCADAVAARRQYNGDSKVTFTFDADPEVSYTLSSESSYAESSAMFGNADSDEPFDTSSESERLMKIHDLAEQIMASEAASQVCTDVSTAAAGTDGTSPRAKSSQTSLSKIQAESSLMPLAEAAGCSALACFMVSSDEETSKRKTPQGEVLKEHASSPRTSGSNLDASAADPLGDSSTPVIATSQQSRGRRRKQAAPFKSPTADDPTFKGAVVHMRLQMVRGQPQLKMEHYYNNLQRRRMVRQDYAELTESEDDFEFARTDNPERKGKQCASCATKLTPLWRDAEDGTPLCNACGIRYKKYKVRCSGCWHIPKKNENTRNNCRACGATLQFMIRKSFL